ncbi:MAG TPA: MoxR family ATPase [Pirellulales bacterium]|nr:MoxR family ATPase [Pirellulales bacterium]
MEPLPMAMGEQAQSHKHGPMPEQFVTSAAEQVAGAHRMMLAQMQRVIVGQQEVLDLMLLGLFCQGHCILEGVPGLAKTLMISSLSQLLALRFNRVQFTPDLMPSDITGTEILQEDKRTGNRELRFVKGPLFANLILADEINRTPPKTQAALLQAMQEFHVTVAGQTWELERPFFVLGTQNPIESEGTYPLPEAQLDRFMFKIKVGYPTLDDEVNIAMQTTSSAGAKLDPVLNKQHILKIQQIVRHVIVSKSVAHYAVRLVRSTRPQETEYDYVRHYLTWGAGPRACQALLLGAKARALLDGRPHVSLDDVRGLAKPVLRHRIVTSFAAESENISSDDVVDQLVSDLPETV